MPVLMEVTTKRSPEATSSGLHPNLSLSAPVPAASANAPISALLRAQSISSALTNRKYFS
jgi:hypothetical protein